MTSNEKCAVIEGSTEDSSGLSSLLRKWVWPIILTKSTSKSELQLPEMDVDWVCPQMERRGIHLHTIHP